MRPRRIRNSKINRLRPVVAGGVALATLTAVAVAAPLTASAAVTSLTFSTSVFGVSGAPLYTTDASTVGITVTNSSTTTRRIWDTGFVIPSSVTGFSLGTVTGANWTETLLPCGTIPNCTAVVDLRAAAPVRTNGLAPGQSLTATLNLTATTPGTLTFSVLHHDDDEYTIVGGGPSWAVIDGVVTNFGVAVGTPVTAGTPTTVTVQSRNAANQVVPFAGGPVTYSLLNADLNAAASLNGGAFVGGTSETSSIPATYSGSWTVPMTLTKAQSQTVTATDAAITGVSNPFVVQPGPPASLTIDSVVDTSSTPALPSPAANKPFNVAFTAWDAYGNIATTPAVPVTLTTTNSAGGLLTVNTVSPSTDGTTGHGVLSASFSAAQIGLNLLLSSGSLIPGTATINVSLAGAAIVGTPGTPGSLNAGTAGANLGNGAYGNVYLTQTLCSTTDPTCSQGYETTLAGTFSDPTLGTHLYSDAAPASMSWTCDVLVCPHADGDPATSAYPGTGGEEEESPAYEQIEDFNKYPMYVSIFKNGAYQPFAKATPCRPLTSWSQRGLTGQMTDPTAIANGFCVDVYAISRAGGVTGGALTMPVLFVEDPKLRP